MSNHTGSNKGRVWISKNNSSKMILKEELDEYLSDGWVKGHCTDSQKEQHKKWYNNGIQNILVKKGEDVPEGFVPGMYQKRPNGYSKFEYHWYTDGIHQKRLSIKNGDIIPEGWHKGQCESHKLKNKESQLKLGNYHLKNKNYTDDYIELYHNENKLREFVLNNRNLSLQELSDKFNCSIWSVYSLLNTYNLQKEFDWYGVSNNGWSGTSEPEKTLVNYIKTIYSGDVIENYRKLIPPQEVDIYIPDKNIAIEYNGTFWHSNLNKPKNYHFEKSKKCQDIGVRLIHIYEWDLFSNNEPKIKSLLNISLGNSSRIYARNCSIKKITNSEAKIFNELNHLQGHRNAQVTYGLFYKDALVQLMSFSKTKYNKNLKSDNDWEIIRGCPGSNNIVVGGVEKLFKHFIQDYNPNKIFSYCDFNKFDGRSYEAIGMKFVGYTSPDKTWIIDGKPVKRCPSKYKELKEISDCIVWGSGSKKYIWEKDFMF